MTDKRILKTKKALKTTLIEMMKEQPLQKIKVKDICEQANTSKLTFYTHYDDKYALLQDVALDIEQEVIQKYNELMERPTDDEPIVKHNRNLVKAIIYAEDKYAQIFETASREKNYGFFLMLFDMLENAFTDQKRFLAEVVKTEYPVPELAAFFLTGMWGYTRTAKKYGVSDDDLYHQLLSLTTDISKSDIFIK